MRIGTIGPLGAARIAPAIPNRETGERAAGERLRAEAQPARALVALDGGRREEPRAVPHPGDGRPRASFVAQLIVAGDPSLRPSRLERTRAAAALYAETARRLA